MTKKSVQIGLIAGALLIVGGISAAFYVDKSQKSAKQEVFTPTNGESVEDLIKKSASEMIDPEKVIENETKNNPAKDQPISDICLQQQSSDFSCYEDYYKALVKQKGLAAA